MVDQGNHRARHGSVRVGQRIGERLQRQARAPGGGEFHVAMQGRGGHDGHEVQASACACPSGKGVRRGAAEHAVRRHARQRGCALADPGDAPRGVQQQHRRGQDVEGRVQQGGVRLQPGGLLQGRVRRATTGADVVQHPPRSARDEFRAQALLPGLTDAHVVEKGPGGHGKAKAQRKA